MRNPQQRQVHALEHPLFPVPSSDDRAAYDIARNEVATNGIACSLGAFTQILEETTHPSAHCDVCKQEPIIGVRHKCLDCPRTPSLPS